MSQALYRIWRPSSWEEVVGQEHIVQTLRNAVGSDRVGQAYLFAGPRGTGKTTSARLLAKAVNCLAEDRTKRPCNACENCNAINEGRFLDLIEIDAASNTSVDDVRELREKINFSPSQGAFKVYIIDEVHMLSTSAFNALLKTLEEPPAHVIFILATTEIHKIPATVLSRCQRHEFRRIPVQVILEKLKTICEQEKIAVDDDALNLIARQSTGSMRDAISLVDQLSSLEAHITLATAQDILGTATNQAVIDLVQAMLDRESGVGLEIIHQTLDGGADPRQFARQVVEYLRSLLVLKLNAGKDLQLLPEVRSVMDSQTSRYGMQQLLEAIDSFSGAGTDIKANWHPGLGLELAFASSVADRLEQVPKVIDLKNTQTVEKKQQTVPVVTPKEKEVEPPAPKAEKDSTGTDTGDQPIKRTHSKKGQSANVPEEIETPDIHGLSLESVKQDWEIIRKEVRVEDPIAAALLNSCKLLRADNSTITLHFSSELLRDRMMAEKPLKSLKKVLTKHYQQDIGILCITGSIELFGADPEEIPPNGLVEMTVRELGGKVRRTNINKKAKE